MANDVDQDRLGAKTENQNVVNLDAYRAAAVDKQVTEAYKPKSIAIWIVGLVIFLLFFRII